MKPTPEAIAALANQIAEAEAKLQNLEWEIEEIGQPAAHELQRRLDALKIEEHALKRNVEEALGMEEPGDARMAKRYRDRRGPRPAPTSGARKPRWNARRSFSINRRPLPRRSPPKPAAASSSYACARSNASSVIIIRSAPRSS